MTSPIRASAASTAPASGFVSEPVSQQAASAATFGYRGRSQSPVAGGAGGSTGPFRSASHRLATTPSAWPESTMMPSPRTPRQVHGGGTEIRLGVVMAELQRQVADERRSVHRQLEHIERRLQDQITGPAAGRERWADLQGSVSGLLEEMSSLARRVEGLDEKLRLRTSSVEELVRQRTRELEQQLHAQQQKALLATSTAEEMSKRQTAKIRKLGQSFEEQARKLQSIEDAYRRPQESTSMVSTMRLEARLSELEGQQASLEDEFRSLAASTAAAQVGAALTREGHSPDGLGERGPPNALDFDLAGGYDALRALEIDIANLSSKTTAQLDEHSAALANLRVRSDGQEHRLTAASERLETLLAPQLEALRSEVAQLRDHDRQETESRFEHIQRQFQNLTESCEEVQLELRERLEEVSSLQLQSSTRFPEEHPDLRRLSENLVAQGQQLRRLETQLQHGSVGANTVPGSAHAMMLQREEEFCSLLVRVEGLEQRLESIEDHGAGSETIAQKADRSEVLRLDAQLREFSEPVRRLSQRAVTGDSRVSALERRLEQMQQILDAAANGHGSGSGSGSATELHKQSSDRNSTANEEIASANTARVEALLRQVAELSARVIEIESLSDSQSAVDGTAIQDTMMRLAKNEDALAAVRLDIEEICMLRSQPSKVDASHSDIFLAEVRETQAAVKALTYEVRPALKELSKRLDESANEFEDVQKLLSSSSPVVGNSSPISEEVTTRLEEFGAKLSKILTRLDAGETLSRTLSGMLAGDRTSQKAMSDNLDELSDKVRSLTQEVRPALEDLKKAPVIKASSTENSGSTAKLEELKGKVEKILTRLDAGETLSRTLSTMIQEDRRTQKAVREDLEDVQNKVRLLGSSDQLRAEFKAEQAKCREELLQRLSSPAVSAVEESELKELRSQLDDVKERVASDAKELVEKLRGDLVTEQNSLRSEIDTRIKDIKDEVAQLCSMRSAANDASFDPKVVLEELSDVKDSLKIEEASVRDLKVTFEEMMQRLEATESASKAVREELMCANEQPKGTDAKTDQTLRRLTEDLEDVKTDLESQQASLKLFMERLQVVASQVEALEKAPPDSAAASSNTAGAASNVEQMKRLEARVEDLRLQVSAEVDELIKHQHHLAKAGLASGNNSSAPMTEASVKELERNISELSKKVLEEYAELTKHQSELLKAKADFGKSSVGEKQAVSVPLIGSDQTEKVAQLEKQVNEELDALFKQQKELGVAKASIEHLSKQVEGVVTDVSECKKANTSLSLRLDKISAAPAVDATPAMAASKASNLKGLAPLSAISAKAETPLLASLNSARGNSSSAPTSRVAGGRLGAALNSAKAVADADSDGSGGYDDEFDESVEEASLSTSK